MLMDDVLVAFGTPTVAPMKKLAAVDVMMAYRSRQSKEER